MFLVARLWQLIFIRLLVCGLVQPVTALATSLVICPVASLTVTVVAVLRLCLRKVYDNFMYFSFLKWRARVPSHDTFVARRVAG